MLGEQGQSRRHLRDVREPGNLLRRGLLERQLRAGQEEVVDEVRARLSELREVGEHGLVRRDQIAAALPEPEPGLIRLLRRQRHRQIGADASERVSVLRLRAVEARSRGSRL